MSKPFCEVLFEIRYPTTITRAALDWNCSTETVELYFKRALKQQLLFKGRKGFIPTEQLLDAWETLGLIP